MKTKQKRYHLIESVIFLLFLSFSMVSCEKAEWIIDEDEPIDHSDNDQTVFMYLPWSSDLLPFFTTNINDMKTVIEKNILKNERVIVFLATSPTEATLSELTYKKGKCEEKVLKEYIFEEDPEYTTAEGITSILNDVKYYAPAKRFAMTIGCHGMGWIPKSSTKSRSSFGVEKMHWEYENVPMTRYFGGHEYKYQTDVSTLVTGISGAGLKMEYILFDDCYMSNVEVAYELKEVTNHLIASTSEIMIDGMPYDKIGQYLIGNIDYKSICDEFYDFYSTYDTPCGTIGVTDCSELDNLASIMKQINLQYTFDTSLINSLQRLDGYSPVIFFDYGDYVSKLCKDSELLEQFNEQLERTVPFKRNTDTYYSMSKGEIKINVFSGITISDPSTNSKTLSKEETAWYKATH